MENTELEVIFSHLYNSYIDDLYAYGKALGVRSEDLQDVIHDVFLHVIDHYDNLNFYDDNVKYYLLKSMKNKIVSNMRQQKDAHNIESVNEYDFPIHVTGLDILIDKEEQTSLTSRIESMLKHLTSRQREAIYLRYMQELSYQEIAGLLNITEKGSRKLVSRAIIELKSLRFLAH